MKMLVLGMLVDWILNIYCHNETAIDGDGSVYLGNSLTDEEVPAVITANWPVEVRLHLTVIPKLDHRGPSSCR